MNTLPIAPETTSAACCGDTCCSEPESAVEAPAVPAAEEERIRALVRSYYAERAVTGSSCCGAGCGCGDPAADADRVGAAVGYSEEELRAVPEGANLGLGCGNPTALDSIPAGATVLDLGSGAGFDCFLAARKVGPAGRVIGVDMTPEMIERARANAAAAGLANVEFRPGHIEALPVADASVDVVLSNCVINLSPDKQRVFDEAYRVLRPGGRLMISDIVLKRALPAAVRKSAAAYAGCLGGAELKHRYLSRIEQAGFTAIEVTREVPGLDDGWAWLPEALRAEAAAVMGQGSPAVSVSVTATKPAVP